MVFAVDDDVHHGGGLCWWWQKHSVDDVDYTVVCRDVGHSDRGVVDHDRTVHDGDGHVLTEHGGDHLTVREVGAHGRGVDHVVEQDVSEAFEGEEVFGCDAEFSHEGGYGIICWCKNSKWTITGQGTGEICLDHGSFEQRMVVAVDHHIDHGGLGL